MVALSATLVRLMYCFSIIRKQSCFHTKNCVCIQLNLYIDFILICAEDKKPITIKKDAVVSYSKSSHNHAVSSLLFCPYNYGWRYYCHNDADFSSTNHMSFVLCTYFYSFGTVLFQCSIHISYCKLLFYGWCCTSYF
jgi:hypothetical protein